MTIGILCQMQSEQFAARAENLRSNVERILQARGEYLNTIRESNQSLRAAIAARVSGAEQLDAVRAAEITMCKEELLAQKSALSQLDDGLESEIQKVRSLLNQRNAKIQTLLQQADPQTNATSLYQISSSRIAEIDRACTELQAQSNAIRATMGSAGTAGWDPMMRVGQDSNIKGGITHIYTHLFSALDKLIKKQEQQREQTLNHQIYVGKQYHLQPSLPKQAKDRYGHWVYEKQIPLQHEQQAVEAQLAQITWRLKE